MKNFTLRRVLLVVVLPFSILTTHLSHAATNADFTALPTGAALPNKPNVILNLSVETPMQGAAYNDEFDAGETDPALQCTGNFARGDYIKWPTTTDTTTVGRCYHPTKVYLGYFDPQKCYIYSNGNQRFEPDSVMSGSAADQHTCSGQYSGNFMNWATMSSIDAFRWVMTGGHRSTDTTSETVLERTYINEGVDSYHSWFPVKGIFSSIHGVEQGVYPRDVTPFDVTDLFITKHSDTGNPTNDINLRIKFGRMPDENEQSSFGTAYKENMFVRVQVCDTTVGTEANCQEYTDSSGNKTLKPTGLMHEFANQMRFSLFSYLNDDTIERQGGVMRARMKDVGPQGTDSAGSVITNPYSEWDEETGIYISNPDSSDASTYGGVSNSGVMNYLNKFGVNGYKSKDPVSEMFYECLRYYRNMGPTNDAVKNLTPTLRDDFPVITSWDDPIQASCQKNYIVGLNDVYAHRDKRVPGTYASSDDSGEGDYGSPDTSDTLNSTYWTNLVGQHEFTAANNLATFKIGSPIDVTAGGAVTTTYGATQNGSALNLGETFIGRRNSYYAAGLAYWANTNNIRPDLGTDESPVTVQTFFVDSQEYNSYPTLGPENILYLAAKYGGFNDLNGSGTPDDEGEWAVQIPNPAYTLGSSLPETISSTILLHAGSNAGATVKLPSNYAVASNPQAMADGLRNAFVQIAAEEERSGTAPANLSNQTGNGGLLVQALYFQQEKNDDSNEEVNWTGQIHAFFVDEFGLFRDDSGSIPNELDADDKVFFYILELEDSELKLKIQRYNPEDNPDNSHTEDTLTKFGSSQSLDELVTIWSAHDVLSNYDNSSIKSQRAYTTVATNSGAARYIFTLLDQNVDGAGVQTDFTDSAITNANNFIFDPLGATTADKLTNAQNIVNYIRGYEDAALSQRSRTLDAGTTDEEVFRLGDIVNSTPIIIAGPLSSYDSELGDADYAAFRTKYGDRREVLYAGANDGLIHAFNIGFRTTGSLGTSLAFEETDPTGGGRVAHKLGAELWAYAPNALLPHLQWLTNTSYAHVFYNDGKIKAYDAKIFTPSADYPGGWGTILIVGMRLGGGDFGLDSNGDSVDDYTTQSAYIILDVTNPELAPKVLAEISDPDLNYTTSIPVLDKDISTGTWSLVFGSGPNNLQFSTNEPAKIFTYDISDLGKNPNPLIVNNITNTNTFAVPSANKSFVGSLNAKDWNGDYTDDVIYFGTVGTKTVTTPSTFEAETGAVYRYLPRSVNDLTATPTSAGISLLHDTDRPVQATPLALKSGGKERVFFGTGRFFSEYDAINPNYTYQERYYGIIEPDANSDGNNEYSASVGNGSLLDVTGIQVTVDDPATTAVDESGQINDSGSVLPSPPPTIDTTADLADYISENTSGWYRDLPNNGTNPSDRVFTDTAAIAGLLLFTAFEPNDNLCAASQGKSNVYGLDMTTGSAPGFNIFGKLDDDGYSSVSSDDFDGRASEVVLFSGGGLDNDKARGYIQLDNGRILNLPLTISGPATPSDRRRSWREIILD